MTTLKFAHDKAESLLSSIDKAASFLQENFPKLGMTFEEAKPLVNALDTLADQIEVQSFGATSFEARKAEVLQKDSDESYMGTFANPMQPHQVESDEPYMGAYRDDQSSAVRDGKSSTGRPLAPLEGFAMIDYQQLAAGFEAGDVVHKIDIQSGDVSPYAGMVHASHPGLGVLDIQWPFGYERLHADEVVKANPKLLRFLPPSLVQVPATYDIQKANRQASEALALPWQTMAFTPEVYRRMASLWHQKYSEVRTYDTLYREVAAVDDEALRQEVGRFYLVASNLGAMRLTKQAAYWVAQNRQHRVSQEEINSKRPLCPRCATRMRKTTYKMDKGARVRLWACPKDLFLIKQDQLLGPDGQAVDW